MENLQKKKTKNKITYQTHHIQYWQYLYLKWTRTHTGPISSGISTWIVSEQVQLPSKMMKGTKIKYTKIAVTCIERTVWIPSWPYTFICVGGKKTIHFTISNVSLCKCDWMENLFFLCLVLLSPSHCLTLKWVWTIFLNVSPKRVHQSVPI